MCVCVGSVSRLCVRVRVCFACLSAPIVYCRVAGTVSGSVIMRNLTPEHANYEGNSPVGVDQNVPPDSVHRGFRC